MHSYYLILVCFVLSAVHAVDMPNKIARVVFLTELPVSHQATHKRHSRLVNERAGQSIRLCWAFRKPITLLAGSFPAAAPHGRDEQRCCPC